MRRSLMGFPKVGMHHADVKKRVNRLKKSIDQGDTESKKRQIESLIKQADIHQKGAGADIQAGMNRDSEIGIKSRGVYTVGICLNEVACKFQNILCNQCFKKNKYEPEEKKNEKS